MRQLAFFFSTDVLLAMVAGYAVCLGLFFVDFLRDNRIANRLGLGILGVVWGLESVYMGVRIYADHALPFFSADEVTVMFAWLLITASALMSLFYRIDFFTLFVNLLGFLMVAFDILVHTRGSAPVPRLSVLLLLHIGTAFLSYLAFTVSCIFSLLYLLAESALRSKRFRSGPFRRLPPLARLDAIAYRSALVGAPLLLIAIILGSVWYATLTGRFFVWDAKTIVTELLLALYAVLLSLRAAGAIAGRWAARLNVTAFAIVLLNFLVVGEFASKFHRW